MAIPGVPSDIEETRTIEFRLGVSYQLNEIAGKVAAWFGGSGNYSDKMAQIEDRFDDLVAEERTERHGDTRNTDIDLERRWIIKPRPMDVAPLLDRDDMNTTKLDLQAPINVQVAKAVRRAQAVRWVQGYYGNAYVGETGVTAIPFKATNVIPDGGVGVTKNKLIAMRELIQTRLVDLDEEGMPIMLVTAKQVSDLLKINEVVSKDYNPLVTQALQNGKVAEFMGFRFIPTELGSTKTYPNGAAALTVNGDGHRLNPVFIPRGIHKGVWGEEFFGRVTERDDKSFSWQVYGETTTAYTRVDEDLCFQMENVET